MLIDRHNVFLAFMIRPTFLHSLPTHDSSFCDCLISSERSELLSAKSNSVMVTLGCLWDFLGCMVKPSSSSWCYLSHSVSRTKRKWANVLPWSTPAAISNICVYQSGKMTVAFVLVYICSITQSLWGG
jgi:hypothetical protein